MSEKKKIKDIISELKNTNEYKRSKAIADCITFLSNKIKDLELSNDNLNIKINDLNKKKSSETELNFKLKSEIKVLKNQAELYKTKLSVTEELNKTLERTILELKNKLNSDKMSYNQKNAQISSSLNKYKNIIEDLKKERDKNENSINNLIKEKKILYNEKEKLKKNEELNKQLKYKIKKYEVLLYKMDLENQGYKDEIQKYQNQISTLTGQTINFIPIYKIDLNAELETIEGNNNNNLDNESNNNKNENIEINIENNIEENKNNDKFEDNIEDNNEYNEEKYINTEDINYQNNDEEKNNSEEDIENFDENNENNDDNNSKANKSKIKK